jgi:hypothetical protein
MKATFGGFLFDTSILIPVFFKPYHSLLGSFTMRCSSAGSFHKEFDTDRRPHLLKKALERCEAKGWIVRVSGGDGSSGTKCTLDMGRALLL